METLVGGAALGSAFELLFNAVTEAIQEVVNFKSSFTHLMLTLSHLKPIFDDIENLNRVLDRPREETARFVDLLIEGEKLIRKCSRINSWNILKKYIYAKKLAELKSSLLWFFNVIVPVDISRDSKSILVRVDDINEKLDEIKSTLNKSLVVSNGSAGGCDVPGLPEFVVGLDVPLGEVKQLLLRSDDDEQVVVISAPGGCGKTTLAKKLCNDEQIRGHYGSNIFFVIVSKNPNMRLIVEKIFQSKNFQVPNFQNDEDAITQLENFTRSKCQGPALLVLDDVWLASESLVEDFTFPIPGYKVLVTSRFVFRRFVSYNLKLLNEQDALTLFRYSAFKNQTCHVQDDLVEKVVRCCHGSPLALKVVGKSLRRQPEVKWFRRIQKWPEDFFTTNNDILECLETSISVLDGGLKDCFLDLASFPEDQKIPATALRDIWVELYEHGEDGMDTVDHLLQLSIRNLVDLSLAREGAHDAIDNCNEHFVMQHDLLRELAVHLSSQGTIDQMRRLIVEIKGNDLPKWWTEHKQQPNHARLLSISTDETFSSKWQDIQLPSVEALILNLGSREYSLPLFIERMNCLKVMIISNNGFFPAKMVDVPFLGDLINLKRIRLEYIYFPSIDQPLLQLRNLKKMSLITCEIGDAFEKLSLPISNIWPNLEELNIDYCHDLIELPAALCDLIHLKKLCISYCQELLELPEELGNLTNLEVLRLHSCTRLSVLPESIGRLRKLEILDISGCVEMESLPRCIGQLCALRVINMGGCWGLYDLPDEVADLMQLRLVICNEETQHKWEFFRRYLKNLIIKVEKQDINLRWLHKFSA